MRESILTRRSEVEVPVTLPKNDTPDAADLFDLTFHLRGASPKGEDQKAAASEAADSRKAADAVINTLHLIRIHGVTATN
jgi:hypothetical protein